MCHPQTSSKIHICCSLKETSDVDHSGGQRWENFIDMEKGFVCKYTATDLELLSSKSYGVSLTLLKSNLKITFFISIPNGTIYVKLYFHPRSQLTANFNHHLFDNSKANFVLVFNNVFVLLVSCIRNILFLLKIWHFILTFKNKPYMISIPNRTNLRRIILSDWTLTVNFNRVLCDN